MSLKEKDKTPSPAKLETERKYGEGAINEFKIRDTKTDPTLFYLVNAIDKDVRVEACKEILKRALTDIYFGKNETELVKQKDLVRYVAEKNAPVPSQQWMFSVGEAVLSEIVNIDNVIEELDTSRTESIETNPVLIDNQEDVDTEGSNGEYVEDVSSQLKSENVVIDDFKDDSPF